MFGLLFYFRSLCRRVTESSSQGHILRSALQRNFEFQIIIAIGMGLGTLFYLLVPITTFFVDKKLVALMPLEILFCDQSTTYGFFFANSVQATMGLHLYLFTLTYTSLFVTYITNYSVQVNLLAIDFNHLDKMWTGEINQPVAYRHAFLLNICKKRQDSNKFVFL